MASEPSKQSRAVTVGGLGDSSGSHKWIAGYTLTSRLIEIQVTFQDRAGAMHTCTARTEAPERSCRGVPGPWTSCQGLGRAAGDCWAGGTGNHRGVSVKSTSTHRVSSGQQQCQQNVTS